MSTIDAKFSPAPHPFNKRTADTVLASSDNVAFRVHSQILSEASSFGEDMFSLPKATLEEPSHMPTNTFADVQPTFEGLPCISVSESSGTLEHLLRICYPVQDPSISNLEELDLILAAAIKYDMPEATGILKLRLREFTQDAPLAVYCIACRHDDEDIAAHAAQEVHSHNLQDVYVPQLRQIGIGCYNRLLRYGRYHHKWEETQLPPPPFSFIREFWPDNTEPNFAGFLGANVSESHQTAAIPAACDASFTQSLRHSDIILRSRDGHEYPVHEDILTLASAYLAQKIRDARTAYEQDAQKDADATGTYQLVVSIQKDGSTLSLLLRMIYPVDVYSHDRICVDVMCCALVAARKLQIEVIAEDLANRITAASENCPMKTFFACLNYGLFEEAGRTVPIIMTRGQEVLYAYLSEMDSYGSLSAETYFRLLHYHRRCQQVALSWCQELQSSGTSLWSDSQNNDRCGYCWSFSCEMETDFLNCFRRLIAAGDSCLYAARPFGTLFSFLSQNGNKHRDATRWREYAEVFASQLEVALPAFDLHADLAQGVTTE